MKRPGVFTILLIFTVLFSGCAVGKDSEEKIRDIDFTVVQKADAPKELQKIIDDNKEEEMDRVYGEEGYLYLIKGYGEQQTSGYSVEVTECYETEDTICVKTNLLGPPKGEEITEKPTYPYVIIKIEYSEKNVTFL